MAWPDERPDAGLAGRTPRVRPAACPTNHDGSAYRLNNPLFIEAPHDSLRDANLFDLLRDLASRFYRDF
jgi:hypothetical protein